MCSSDLALIVAAGVAVLILARRLPVMSARFERRAEPASRSAHAPAGRPRAAATSMWESLSAGTDPTVTGPD